MSEVKLVAVEHDDSGNLVGFNMFPLVQREVVPYLNAKCVIVTEGGKNRGILRPHDPHYDVIYRQLGPIAFSGVRPKLHSTDALYQFRAPEQVVNGIQRFNEYFAAAQKSIAIQGVPNTWDDLIRKVRNNDHAVTVVGELSDEWKQFGREEMEISLARDKLFAEQILHHAHAKKRVFFVGGVLHCITLAALHKWPVIRYECSPEYIQSIYTSWYFLNKAAEHP